MVAGMDGLQLTLKQSLTNYFQVVPTATNRQDQLFKRAVQWWTEEDPERKLLILSATAGRNEWAPKALQFSAQFARTVNDEASQLKQQMKSSQVPVPKNKVFPDEALDPSDPLRLDNCYDTVYLTPRMQRLSFWQDKTVLLDKARAIKILLWREHLEPVLLLASRPELGIRHAASLASGRKSGAEVLGWATVVDEAMEMYLFLGILDAFPEELVASDRYENWIPYGLAPSHVRDKESRPIQLMEAYRKQSHSKAAVPWRQVQQQYMHHSIRVLAHAQVLFEACALPPPEWEKRVSNWLLYFIGFEAWNRARQGQGYLHCDLNEGKTVNWLLSRTGREELQLAKEIQSANEKPLMSRRDPLHLREPKHDVVAEEEQDGDEPDELAVLEAEEAAYGTRRSEKYQRRRS